jgi:hypothetical protein
MFFQSDIEDVPEFTRATRPRRCSAWALSAVRANLSLGNRSARMGLIPGLVNHTRQRSHEYQRSIVATQHWSPCADNSVQHARGGDAGSPGESGWLSMLVAAFFCGSRQPTQE